MPGRLIWRSSVGYGLFAKYRIIFVDSAGTTVWTKTGHSADGVVEKLAIGVPGNGWKTAP